MPLNLFSRTSIVISLPDGMQKTLYEINNSSDQKACLEKTYTILNKKYRGYRTKTYTHLFDIFISNIDVLWEKEGFMHCSNINYILKTFLIKSNFFEEEDIQLVWTHVWYISPHQYVKVRINNTWIHIDIWAATYGIKFGDNAHGFHSST